MTLTHKHFGAILGVVCAALVVDNFRLRVTCRSLEKVVDYAVGGIHLDGVGGIYDDDNELNSEMDSQHEA